MHGKRHNGRKMDLVSRPLRAYAKTELANPPTRTSAHELRRCARLSFGRCSHRNGSSSKSFLIATVVANDNLIFSLGYSKDDSEKYLMLFNKELTGSKKYTINADASSGLTSLTWYKPDSFETLPDYTKPLAAPEQIEISVENGSFEVELQAGELRVYKLNGDLNIREPLKSPVLSHKSGTYLGQQTVTLTSYDEGAEIYYTTDGSYPTYRSERYTSPIIVGQDGELGFFDIKAIAVRGTEISDAVIGRYIISDGSQNVALSREPTFTGETEAFQGSVLPSTVTDGSFDPHNTWGSAPNSPCFAVVDFGKEYTIDRVLVKAWHDWDFNDVVIQLALDENFTQGVYTVFNNDTDNSAGAGAGTDGAYKENPNGGHGFGFAPVKARYMRFITLRRTLAIKAFGKKCKHILRIARERNFFQTRRLGGLRAAALGA